MRRLKTPGILTLSISGLIAVLSGASMDPAAAQTATTTFQVTATVQATCLITANPLAFGTYAGTQTDASTTISVTCTNTSAYNVALSAGNAVGATVTTRGMTGPGLAVLNYGLYTNPARSTNWGETVGTDTVAGVGSGTAQILTVYGRVPAGQFVTPGAYVDTITATISF